jgi:hypothetical protein
MKNIYQVVAEEKTPFLAGQKCEGLSSVGELSGDFINPFEPDTKDGEDFLEGVYSARIAQGQQVVVDLKERKNANRSK